MCKTSFANLECNLWLLKILTNMVELKNKNIELNIIVIRIIK